MNFIAWPITYFKEISYRVGKKADVVDILLAYRYKSGWRLALRQTYTRD